MKAEESTNATVKLRDVGAGGIFEWFDMLLIKSDRSQWNGTATCVRLTDGFLTEIDLDQDVKYYSNAVVIY